MKEIADHMVADGYKDAGYEYVSIDVSAHDPVHCGSFLSYCFFFFFFFFLQKLTLQNKQITLTIPTLHTKYILCVYINTLQINYNTVK